MKIEWSCLFVYLGLGVFGDDNKIYIKRLLSRLFNLYVVGEGLRCGEFKIRSLCMYF